MHNLQFDDRYYRRLFCEIERMAPIASKWSGRRIPPEIAFVQAHIEKNLVNSKTGETWGHFGLTPPVFHRYSRRIGAFCPAPKSFRTRADWYAAVHHYAVNHPIQQVKVFYAFLADVLTFRKVDGNLNRAWQYYRWGRIGGDDYAKDCRSVWARWWPDVLFRKKLLPLISSTVSGYTLVSQ